jgi:histidinol-phosphate aminotransferase
MNNIRLHMNEFRSEHCHNVISGVKKFMRDADMNVFLSDYCNTGTLSITKNISNAFGFEEENILVSSGSDDILKIILQESKLVNVIIGVPSYTNFESISKTLGKKITQFSLGLDSTELEYSGMIEYYYVLLSVGAIVYIGNLNNPTGNTFSAGKLSYLAKKYPNSIYIIDEAYIEYIGYNKSLSHLALEYDNIIVVRTLSKAFGLASIRVGYMITKNKTKYEPYIDPKNMNKLTEKIVELVLENKNYYLEEVKKLLERKAELVEYLEENNWIVKNTNGNFILINLGKDVKTIIRELEKKNIYVRDRTDLPCLQYHIRLTIGSKSDIEQLRYVLCWYNGTNLISYPQKFYTNKAHITKLKCLLKLLVYLFDASELRCWATNSTMLGAIRHGGIVPWDETLNFSMMNCDLTDWKMKVLKNNLSRYGLVLQKDVTKKYWQIGENRQGEIISEIHANLYLSGFNHNGKIINTDIGFCKSSGMEYCEIVYNNMGDIFPLVKIKMYDIEAKVPKKHNEFLSKVYGNDFMTIAKIKTLSREEETFQISEFSPA